VACITLALNIVWLRICNKFLVIIGTNGSLQVANIVHHPINYCVSMFRTYSGNTRMLLVQMVGGALGKLTIPTNNIMVIAYLFGMFHKLTESCHIGAFKERIYERVICGIVICVIIILISTSLYIQWTPAGQNTISGLQGRYFIPLLMPLYFMVTGTKHVENQEDEHISFIFSTIALTFNICSGVAILFYCIG